MLRNAFFVAACAAFLTGCTPVALTGTGGGYTSYVDQQIAAGKAPAEITVFANGKGQPMSCGEYLARTYALKDPSEAIIANRDACTRAGYVPNWGGNGSGGSVAPTPTPTPPANNGGGNNDGNSGNGGSNGGGGNTAVNPRIPAIPAVVNSGNTALSTTGGGADRIFAFTRMGQSDWDFKISDDPWSKVLAAWKAGASAGKMGFFGSDATGRYRIVSVGDTPSNGWSAELEYGAVSVNSDDSMNLSIYVSPVLLQSVTGKWSIQIKSEAGVLVAWMNVWRVKDKVGQPNLFHTIESISDIGFKSKF